MARHPLKHRFSRTTVLTVGAAALCALLLFAGTSSRGLWDPWEMNHSAVAWHMAGTPAVLVIEKGGESGAIAAAVRGGDYKLETASIAAESTGGLDVLRDRTSSSIYAAVLIDPEALAAGAAGTSPDPGSVKTVANAIRSAAERNLSTKFILVSASGSDVATLRSKVIRSSDPEEGKDAPGLDATVLAGSISGAGKAALKDLLDDAACATKATAQFKSGGKTMFMPPLEAWVTSAWLSVLGYHEFSARFTGVLFALMTIALLVFPGRRLFGTGMTAGAVFILSTSLIFTGTARFAGAGMPEVFALTLACIAFGNLILMRDKPVCRCATVTWYAALVAAMALLWLAGGMSAVAIAATVAGTWFIISPDRRSAPAVAVVFALFGAAAALTFLPDAAWFRQFRFTNASFAGGIAMESRTFDFIVKEVGFGFFPWSAFIPVALWTAVSGDSKLKPERLFLLVWAVVPLIAAMVFVRPFGQTMYIGVPGLAILTALFFDELADGTPDSTFITRLFGFFAIGLFFVIMHDMTKSPAPLVSFLTTDPMFSKPGQGDAGFPPNVQIPALGKLFLGLMLLSMLSVTARVSNMTRIVKKAVSGRKVFRVALIVMASLIAIDIAIFTALRWRSITGGSAGSELVRIFLTGPDILALYLLTAILCGLHWWDAIHARVSSMLGARRAAELESAFDAFQTTNVQKPVFIACAAGFSLVMAFSVGPDLTYHLSQKHIVDTWKASSRKDPGPLYRHGNFNSKGSEDTNFYTSNLEEKSSRSEVTSLLADKARRTFFLLPTKQFSEINSAWRDQTKERGLPVLDDRSSRIVLTTSRLAAGETDHNWLAKATLTESEFAGVQGIIRESVNFENTIELVGFSIDPREITRGTKPVLKTYYRVLKKPTKSYRVFLHVDKTGSSTRVHGDHWILNLVPESEDMDDCVGCYATNHWKKGDIIVDTYTLDVPIGSPGGDYDVWMGLYAPGGSRMKVTSFDEDKVREDGTERVRIGKMTIR